MNYVGTGGFTLTSNIFVPTIVRVSYHVKKDFTWTVKEKIVIKKDFTWSTGNNPLFWYRVEGECRSLTAKDCAVTGLNTNNNCGGTSSFFQMVAARNLTDLCQKLKSGILAAATKWPIRSIKKFSRPVHSDAGVPTSNCNELTEQDFCHLQECAGFCLYLDGVATALASAHYNPVFQVVGSGGFFLSGTAPATGGHPEVGDGGFTLTGTAGAACSHYSYVGSGGFSLGGSAGVVSSAHTFTAGGGMSLRGSADRSSSRYDYVGSGGFSLEGDASVDPPILRYVPGYPLLGSLRGSADISGTANYSVGGHGGFTLGGSAGAAGSRQYIASGGFTLRGSAHVVSPVFTYKGSGGFTLRGQAKVGIKHLRGIGGFTLGGTALAKPIIKYTGKGGFTLSGVAETETSGSRTVVGTGGFTLRGSAGNNLKSFTTTASANFALLQLSADFLATPGLPLTVTPITIINKCACPPLPPLLILNQNLTKVGKLADFLSRNVLTIPADILLSYNNSSNAWQKIVHLTGRGDDGNTQENWTLFFDWDCTPTVGDQTMSQNVWKFSASVKRVIPGRGSYDTKILFSFDPTTVCIKNKLQLKFTLNTNNKILTTVPTTKIGSNLLFDEIGLFQDVLWIKSPKLVFNISTRRTQILPRQDITPIFQPLPLVFSN